MAEFKKLSEVEQIETASDNATVLIEEGGDIKRVPKSAVGGNGVGGYVIKLESSYINDDGMYCLDESYDELYDVLVAGGSVWVDYTNAPEASLPSMMAANSNSFYNATNRGAPHLPVLMWMLTDVGLGLMDMMGMQNSGPNIYFPNGSHNLEPKNNPK